MRLIALSLLLIPLLALAACQPGTVPAADKARPTATLGDGAVTVVAPHGWCVDPRSLRDTAGGGFALFGSCSAISGRADDPRPDAAALLSVTVGPADPDGEGRVSRDRLTRIGAFFRTETGRAALARSGRARDVQVLGSEIVDGALLLHVADRSGSAGPPLARTYFRAITDLGGRISALSVLPLRDGEMSEADQRALMARFMRAIRSAN